MKDRITVGLIGCGGMGRGLGRGIRTVEAAELVGVADINPEAVYTASQELEAPGFPSAEALLDRVDPDAVIIAAPGWQHLPLARTAAERGKQIFVEKPMGVSVAECDAMLEATRQAGVSLMVGQVLRWYPCWWKCLELIRSGAIGTPTGIQVTRISRQFENFPQEWRLRRSQSGGLLLEVNAHEIDFMGQVCGPAYRVYAEADRFGQDPADFPNLYYVSIRYQSGAVGLLHASTIAAINDFSGRIQGDQGMIQYADGFGDGTIRVADRAGHEETIRVRSIEKERPIPHELRLWIEALRSGAPVPVTGEQGREVVAIAEAAYDAADSGLPVQMAEAISPSL